MKNNNRSEEYFSETTRQETDDNKKTRQLFCRMFNEWNEKSQYKPRICWWLILNKVNISVISMKNSTQHLRIIQEQACRDFNNWNRLLRLLLCWVSIYLNNPSRKIHCQWRKKIMESLFKEEWNSNHKKKVCCAGISVRNEVPRAISRVAYEYIIVYY